MNVKDILSPGEEVLYSGQQHRLVPGGKEVTPGQIFVTTQRVILETSSMLGIKKEYQDREVLQSRFQGEIHITSLGKKDAQRLEQIINQKMSQGAASDVR